MRKLFIIAASIAALAIPTVAMAGTTTPGSSEFGGASGNGTKVTHYTAAYADAFFGPVACTGVNQVKNNKPTQDSFTCTSTSGSPLSSVSPNQTGTLASLGGWQSDFYPTATLATGGTFTVSADGMSYTAVAIYPTV